MCASILVSYGVDAAHPKAEGQPTKRRDGVGRVQHRRILQHLC
jgi:hypothetical protein